MTNHEPDNRSTTDTLQWCEIHRGRCKDVVPVRRCYDNPKRQSIIFFACQGCISALKKAELISDSKYAGLPCAEIIVPRGLCKSSHALRDPHKPRSRPVSSSQQSYEIALTALQVKYLRALGLRVMFVQQTI